MATHVTVQQGFDEAIKAYLQRQIKERADYVEAEAKALCPVRTGELRDSIKTVTTEEGTVVGTECPHGGYVEYGTTRQSPVAFLRRAYSKMVLAFSRR